jgi:phytoene dehydrogenase-like protein
MADFQVIVIGSGAGGLSAALFLARQGFSVLLLEAMPSFGGYLNPFRDAFMVALQGHNAQTKRLKRVVGIDSKADEFIVKIDSGEQYTAKVVVSNADPVLTLGRLVNPEIVPFKIRKRVSRLRPSLGAFYTFIGTDLDLPFEFATPLSNEYWVNAVGGGSYGPEHTPDQMGSGRFGSFTAGIEGLFLVGAGTLGAGVSACVASGVLAGGDVAKYLESAG